MDRYKKGAVYGLILLFVVTVLATISEVPLLPADKQSVFLITRALFWIGLLSCAYALHNDIENQLVNALAGITMICYSIHGQLYFPLYIFSICQVIVFFSFSFPISRFLFRIISGTGAAIFVTVFYFRWDKFLVQIQHPKLSDIILVVVACVAIAFVSNTFFSSARHYREETVIKFAKIGKETSRVVHDLKGLMGSPLLYLQVLESQLPGTVGEAVSEAMRALAHDLDGFKKILLELNQLTAVKPVHVEPFDVCELIHSIRLTLNKQFDLISLEIFGELYLKTDKFLVSSVILNIVTNAFETMVEAKITNPTLRVVLNHDRMIFSDNGGGFPADVLANITKGRFISSRRLGSGLGLLFVFDGMRKIGGRTKLSNSTTGACVEIIFSKKSLIRSSDIFIRVNADGDLYG